MANQTLKRAGNRFAQTARIRTGIVCTIFLCLIIIVGPCAKSAVAQGQTSAETKAKATTQAPGDQKAEAAPDAKKKTAKKKPVKKEDKPKPPPIEITRYKTLISLMYNTDSGISKTMRSGSTRDIRAVVERTWGRMWDTTWEQNEWIYPAKFDVLSRLTEEELVARYEKTPVDKVHLIAINRAGPQWHVMVREYDKSSQTLTEPTVGSVYQQGRVAELVGQLLQESFRPTVELESTVFDQLELRLKAGEFPAPDPAAEQIVVGDVIKPYLRYKNKRNPEIVEKLQLLPLTYIVVTSVDRGRIKGVQVSGVMSGLGGKRRRVDQMGYRQRPRYKESQLRLILRGRDDRPLVCHRVEVVAKMRSRDKTIGEPLKLLSDRDGRVTISVSDKHSHFWVYVYSGTMLLARVPYAPGLKEYEIIELPDDKVRLRVEGELSLIKGKLIDIVARRAAHMAMAQKYAKDGKWPQSQAEMEAMSKLDGLEEFAGEINAIQVPAIKYTKQNRQRAAEKRITRACNDMMSILKRYFDPEKEVEFKEKLINLRDNAS